MYPTGFSGGSGSTFYPPSASLPRTIHPPVFHDPFHHPPDFVEHNSSSTRPFTRRNSTTSLASLPYDQQSYLPRPGKATRGRSKARPTRGRGRSHPVSRTSSVSSLSTLVSGTHLQHHNPNPLKLHLSPNEPPLIPTAVEYPILDPPAGTTLEVLNLLILRPPAPKAASSTPINQYTSKEARPAEHKSKYEMYTCRLCRRTYDGANARSVARRHLQDKHAVPLSVQGRRSRWDEDPNRPTDQHEARERNLKSKRDWALRFRLQSRIERHHADYLLGFGPNGVVTACGLRLVAPQFRQPFGGVVKPEENVTYLNGSLGVVDIPDEVLKDIRELRQSEAAVKAESERIQIIHPNIDQAAKGKKKGKGKGKAKAGPSQSNTPPRILGFAAYATQTPVSSSRTGQEGFGEETIQDVYRSFGYPQNWYGYEHNPVMEAAYPYMQYGHDFEHQHFESYSHLAGLHIGPEEAILETEAEDIESPAKTSESDATELVELPQQPHPHQQWVPSEPPAYQSWYPKSPSELTEETPIISTSPEEDEEAKAVAESMLNLHSTPARPEDHQAQPDDRQTQSPPPTWPEDQVHIQLLAAPEITSRPRPARSVSLMQAFKPRPNALTHSLSFTTEPMEDPFNSSPAPVPAPQTKRRSTIANPSPSPLQQNKNKRRKQVQIDSPSLIRQPLRAVYPNPNSNSNLGSTPNTAFQFTTPVKARPSPLGLRKGGAGDGQLSSPGHSDAAASLGLVPPQQWMEMTPMSRIGGDETPLHKRG